MKKQQLYIDQLLARFFPSGSWNISIGASGMNNTTRFIEVDHKHYVLRIYETHQDAAKVAYEHHILLALQKLSLPFCTPKPVQTQEGLTFIRSADNKLAALFHFLEGSNPALHTLDELHAFGQAAGQLTDALGNVHSNEEPVYRPYYEIEHTHPRCSLQDVIQFCTNVPTDFAKHTSALTNIKEQLINLQDNIPLLKLLPHQLIHGDLNASNILINDKGHISAVLDFEFVTNDLRVMELAVCVSDILSPSEDETMLWAKLNSFLAGYGSAMKLTADEMYVIPLLIQLRRLDVFIHFLGRYWDGIDSNYIVEEQIHKTIAKTSWLAANSDKLIAMCASHILHGRL